ncbi:MAG: fused MFS/spermidine synthase [Gammaproteobacteria bacterium]
MFVLLALLFFVSGATALIYEMLWLKELGLLFGNTSQAAATTLAAFFLGLALGGYYWCKRAQRYACPLRIYGLLELGVACGALGYFVLLRGYAWLYPFIFSYFVDAPGIFLAVKFVLALTLLFPPAYCMGGTLPVVSQFAVRCTDEQGRTVALLYALNTFGAVLGVFLAGFYLPLRLGYTHSYLAAVIITLAVAITAIITGGFPQNRRRVIIDAERAPLSATPVELKALAFISGAVTLALQVLWNHMFAQVLHNSVYTFALVLAVFLFCLALAGAAVNRLLRYDCDAQLLMFAAMSGGALLVSAVPFAFIAWTDGLHFIGGDAGWYAYLKQAALPALAIMGPTLLCIGMVFPLLPKLGEGQGVASGALVGRLLAWNTVGAIIGSLLAGFVLLDVLGLWASIRLCAVIYWLCAAGYWLHRRSDTAGRWLMLPAVGILSAVSLFDTGRLPVVRIDPVTDDESLLQAWESSAGTIAVLRVGEHLKIKVNNYYTLGGTGSYELERLQGYLPVLLHEQPLAVYMLGLGTGISAGGALSYPIETLCITELLRDVSTASELYFGDYNNNLFYDPRVRVIHEDGRNYLRGSNARFDVIVSDLFVPWNTGTGSLYALEHYRTIAERLTAHGLFMQWLPAYQLTDTEFFSIAKTMQQVFPQVTVWRGGFSALTPIIGLLGQKEQVPLSPRAWLFNSAVENNGKPLLSYYVGNLEALREPMRAAQLNSDDYPLIEFTAPVSQRQVKAGSARWLIGEPLLAVMRQLNVKAAYDTYLSLLQKRQRLLPAAGLYLQEAHWFKYAGKLQAAKQRLQLHRDLLDRAENHSPGGLLLGK